MQDPIKAIQIAIENPPIGIKNEVTKVVIMCRSSVYFDIIFLYHCKTELETEHSYIETFTLTISSQLYIHM